MNKGIPEKFSELLNPNEIEALMQRSTALVTNGSLPYDPSGRQVPWPLL